MTAQNYHTFKTVVSPHLLDTDKSALCTSICPTYKSQQPLKEDFLWKWRWNGEFYQFLLYYGEPKLNLYTS